MDWERQKRSRDRHNEERRLEYFGAPKPPRQDVFPPDAPKTITHLTLNTPMHRYKIDVDAVQSNISNDNQPTKGKVSTKTEQ
jgi:phosphatidylethanolamine-binding protein (PEBP) family uncharacterized protein